MRLTMKGATAKNTRYADKPNEDLFFFDEASGFAMILDGVSRDRENGIYPNPSPACRAGCCNSPTTCSTASTDVGCCGRTRR